MTQALTHFFGSIDGYRTLARAEGVTDLEDAALAALGFGSPRSPSDFESLGEAPCIAGRLLPSGRFAITRLFPGKPDIAGRQTVERRTLILDVEDWVRVLSTNLAAMLLHPPNWARESFEGGEPIRLQLYPASELLPPPADEEMRVFDALVEAQRIRRCAALPHEPRWDRAVLHLGSYLTPDRRRTFGWGVGLWAVPSGVFVATFRSGTRARSLFHAAQEGAWLHADLVERLGQESPDAHVVPRMPVRGPRTRSRGALRLFATLAAALATGAAGWFLRDAMHPSAPSTARTASPPSQTPAPSSVERVDPPRSDPADASRPVASGAIATGIRNPDAPPAGFDAAAREVGFGGMSPPEKTGGTSPPEQPAQDGETTPAAAPTQPESVPPEPLVDESTPWDEQVRLLRDSIDLSTRARTIAEANPANAKSALGVAQQLAVFGDRLRSQALAVDAEIRQPTDRRIFFVDPFQPGTSRSEHGTSRAFNEDLALATFPPTRAQQVALIVARFEIAQAIARIAGGPETSAEVREALKGEDTSGWPAAQPFNRWVLWQRRGSAVPSATALQFMADSFAKRLAGQRGMSSLVRQLRRVAAADASSVTPQRTEPNP